MPGYVWRNLDLAQRLPSCMIWYIIQGYSLNKTWANEISEISRDQYSKKVLYRDIFIKKKCIILDPANPIKTLNLWMTVIDFSIYCLYMLACNLSFYASPRDPMWTSGSVTLLTISNSKVWLWDFFQKLYVSLSISIITKLLKLHILLSTLCP